MVILDNMENVKRVMLDNGDTISIIRINDGWKIVKSFATLHVEVTQYDVAIMKRAFDIKEPIYEV